MEYFNTYTFTTSCANSGPASCDVPSHVIISDTTENSARVSWVAGGTESQWKLQYKSITASNWEPDIILATTSHILSNLQENTAYILRVKAICDSTNESDWTSLVTFTTLTIIIPDTCETPTGLTATAVTAQTITVSWDYEENVDLWNIQYRPDDGAVSSATSTTNTFTLSGLEPETTYEIQVQADCGEGEISDWSEYISVTTPVGIENHLMRYVHLYPNPAKEYIDIRVDGEMHVISMEVYDVYGKLVNMVNVAENPTRINVNGLANGMYFVRVTTDQGEVTKSFVKH
jgi:hypothetical protein